MAFGEGFKHMDSYEYLEEGYYNAKIVKAEIKTNSYGQYIQAEVEVTDHPNCNPHIFLLNDMPKDGYGSMTLEKAQNLWNKNMTSFFASFQIKEGDFEPSHWVGKVGEITVRPQRKEPKYKEIVPFKTKFKKSEPEKKTDFPEDIPYDNEEKPDIF